MFASPAANQLLDSSLEEQVILLPFANQGALRGDFSVFMQYNPSKPSWPEPLSVTPGCWAARQR